MKSFMSQIIVLLRSFPGSPLVFPSFILSKNTHAPSSHLFGHLLSQLQSAMHIMSSTLIPKPEVLSSYSYSYTPNLSKPPTPSHILFNINCKSKIASSISTKSQIFRVSDCLNTRPRAMSPRHGIVSLRIQRLVSEFQSLSEPIDRVKKLLDYATVLPRLSESIRSPENRVSGCAAQVWLEVEINEFGRMRFGADSDSEIIKGFSSCLIFLLDGATPQEVLMVKAEELTDMNVGLPVRSKVNGWNNLLINMQERTRSLMVVKIGEIPPFESIWPESVDSKGYSFRT